MVERGADPNKENLVYPTTSLCYLRINPKEDMYEKTILLAEYGADAFYRGVSRQKEGAGLGLTVAKTLADKLGHEIGAECEAGTFRIWLVLLYSCI